MINRGETVCRLYVKSSGKETGSGVFALHKIFKGQLVCEYIGQIISRDEAKRREEVYRRSGLFYLHDVHGCEGLGGEEAYSIDPTDAGNIGRMCGPRCLGW